MTGTAYCGRDQTTLWIEVPEGLYGATSGSPIVNARGAIVGVVSQVGGSHPDAIERGTTGPGPRPHTTLPVWVVQQIAAAQADVGAADVEALEAHDPGFQP